MPLRKGKDKATIAHNIRVEEAAGRPRKQAIAIALRKARESGSGKRSRVWSFWGRPK